MSDERVDEMWLTLAQCANKPDWNKLLTVVRSKSFHSINAGNTKEFNAVKAIAEILTNTEYEVPNNIKIVLLKCLGNFCLSEYKHKSFDLIPIDDKYCNKLYKNLRQAESEESDCHAHFPFDGVAKWSVDYIDSYQDSEKSLSEDESEILRLCIQFLSNLFTFACKTIINPDYHDMPTVLNTDKFKHTIVSLMTNKKVEITHATSKYIFNALNGLPSDYFTEEQKNCLCKNLIDTTRECFISPKNALLVLLIKHNMIQQMYEELPETDRMLVLEILHETVVELAYEPSKENLRITKDVVRYLSCRFQKRSDLILKTVDTYVENVDPKEIVLLLDIFGVISSIPEDSEFIRDDKSLFINCVYLLKSLHMLGKETENFFTPLQKLSDIATTLKGTSINERLLSNETVTEHKEDEYKNDRSKTDEHPTQEFFNDPQHHPAFGFKAALIRFIGNMTHRNPMCQNLLRELDGIPLLLDSCNIDARNPLIIQWAILALRNVCIDNPENQELIKSAVKIGTIDNEIVDKMGITLHEDEEGKPIKIVTIKQPSN